MDKFYVPSVFSLFVWILRHFITHKTLVKSRVIAVHVAARKPHAGFPQFSRACPLHLPGAGKESSRSARAEVGITWTTRRGRLFRDAVK